MLRQNTNRPPELKSAREIGLMRESGKLVARALKICRELAKPGTKTIEIDQAVEKFYAAHGAIPLFKGYPGKTPFPAVTCLSVNEQVVHGIPGNRVLKEIAPTIYNRAIGDAQTYFQGRVADLEGVCHEKEFTYWTPSSKRPG